MSSILNGQSLKAKMMRIEGIADCAWKRNITSLVFQVCINYGTKAHSSCQDAAMAGSIFIPIWHQIKSCDLLFHPHCSHMSTKRNKSTQN